MCHATREKNARKARGAYATLGAEKRRKRGNLRARRCATIPSPDCARPASFIHSGAPERDGRKLSRKPVYKVDGTSEINLFKLIVVFDFPYCPRPETSVVRKI